MYRLCEVVCTGCVRLCVQAMRGCVYRLCEVVCTGYARLCVQAMRGCVYRLFISQLVRDRATIQLRHSAWTELLNFQTCIS